ncbi:MAG: hypothetical protein HY400_03665 [Elusimicrobia bacterium]|nr:hypothetical protein [Elusimicrobiota bacterium]
MEKQLIRMWLKINSLMRLGQPHSVDRNTNGAVPSLRILRKTGQNTVEYLLMLTVVVGVVLVVGMALKKFMPGFFGQIQQMITGAAGNLGQSQ